MEPVLLVMKTVVARYAGLARAIRTLHSDDLPDIIAVPVSAGLPAYPDWVAQETRKEIDV